MFVVFRNIVPEVSCLTVGSQGRDPRCTRSNESDRLDRRPVHSDKISRDSESREKGSRYCGEGAQKGQTWRVGVHTGSRSVVN